jgi:hypothetical protein
MYLYVYCINRDIDLLRDPKLTGKGDFEKEHIEKAKNMKLGFEPKQNDAPLVRETRWKCIQCSNNYDIIDIEQRYVYIIV